MKNLEEKYIGEAKKQKNYVKDLEKMQETLTKMGNDIMRYSDELNQAGLIPLPHDTQIFMAMKQAGDMLKDDIKVIKKEFGNFKRKMINKL